MLASILLRRKEYYSAIKVLEPAIKLAPDDVALLMLLGNTHMRTKDYEKATQAFQRAAELAPSTKSLNTRLALSQLAMGNQTAASAKLEAAISDS